MPRYGIRKNEESWDQAMPNHNVRDLVVETFIYLLVFYCKNTTTTTSSLPFPQHMQRSCCKLYATNTLPYAKTKKQLNSTVGNKIKYGLLILILRASRLPLLPVRDSTPKINFCFWYDYGFPKFLFLQAQHASQTVLSQLQTYRAAILFEITKLLYPNRRLKVV